MSKGTRSRRKNDDSAVNEASTDALVDPEKDLEGEAKKTWIQKRLKEEKSAKVSRKVDSFYYELDGFKLLKKVRKANGSLYSFYITNIRKYPNVLDSKEIKENAKGESLLRALKSRQK